MLAEVLGLRVLEHLLGLAGAANHVQRPLRQRLRLRRPPGRRPCSASCGAAAADLLDPALELARVRLGLLQVLLQALRGTACGSSSRCAPRAPSRAPSPCRRPRSGTGPACSASDRVGHHFSPSSGLRWPYPGSASPTDGPVTLRRCSRRRSGDWSAAWRWCSGRSFALIPGRSIPERAVGFVMAFGAGVLISAVAFDLTEEAITIGGGVAAALGLGAGALVYYGGDRLIDRGGSGDSDDDAPGDRARSAARRDPRVGGDRADAALGRRGQRLLHRRRFHLQPARVDLRLGRARAEAPATLDPRPLARDRARLGGRRRRSATSCSAAPPTTSWPSSRRSPAARSSACSPTRWSPRR